ncbi:hypothetical protein GGQ22_13315 [Nocardioides sp. zg-579]|uniref:DUF559 domain-containing protein n=1 Tax=Nocardioides marmotae TaxID=2663857 RepID=A0A6I3JD98_9ACTN|nr:hypothetical protein [Nocardioides marmotae]MCR6032413.1 hypothetical protein [Gordonia jinghuaiqii]MTB96062.1 hypothetical protein [Nocardioides marmotae]QKE02617.1 hypothetical protein HPC71_17220 [Nocardioides marmotae]
MTDETWRTVSARQAGMVSRAQLAAVGIDRFAIRNQVAAGRWVLRSPTVVSTTTGEPTRLQKLWLGVLHAGGRSLLGDLTAAEVAGLRGWHREPVTVLVPYDLDLDDDVPGIHIARTRRRLPALQDPTSVLPRMRIEPAVLHFAAYQPSPRTAQGVVAAAVQQRLTSATDLLAWVDRMRPLRKAPLLRAALGEIAHGSQSLSEIDVVRLCRDHGLRPPDRQVRRRDAEGRLRFTDCEWRLADGSVLVLEVDGAFHMEVAHWEDDLARQRRLTTDRRRVVRCTSRELRDEPERLAVDLRRLGVPRAA